MEREWIGIYRHRTGEAWCFYTDNVYRHGNFLSIKQTFKDFIPSHLGRDVIDEVDTHLFRPVIPIEFVDGDGQKACAV